MTNNKVDTQNFLPNNMMAKLFTIQRNYANKHDELINDRQAFDNYVEQLADDNFIFPESQKRGIVAHLSLFLLGNNNNQFSKLAGL